MPTEIPVALIGGGAILVAIGASAEPVILTLESRQTLEQVRQIAPETRLLRPQSANSAFAKPLQGIDRYAVCDLDEQQQQLVSQIAGVSSLEPAPLVRAQHEREPDPFQNALLVPNDPLFDEQWYLMNTGQVVRGEAGTPGADAHVAGAWALVISDDGSDDDSSGHDGVDDKERGGPARLIEPVIVAVIDAGVSESHPELAPHLIPGINLAGGHPNNTDDNLNSHGTAVAGIIAADWSDGEGIAGIAPEAKIMPIRIFNQLGFGSEAWAAEGLIFAVDQGADVIVMSFGFSGGTSAFQDAVRYAEDAGVVMVASTGNIASEPVPFPARWPEVMAVGATDPNDSVTVFSGGGPQIDLVAPGLDILTTVDRPGRTNDYAYETGTSFAAPIVAGVAALIRGVHPTLPARTVRDVIVSTAIDIGERGFDERTGWGRVDARAAVERAIAIRECLADVNQDGQIDGADFSAWLFAFQQGLPEADQNGDGVFNGLDFGAWLKNFSGGCG